MINGLPESFSIREAFDILGWQGSRKGLARHLEAQGFTKSPWYDDRSRDIRIMWRRPPHVAIPCLCRCHTGTCGANDMDLAERAIRLVEMLRPLDVKMVEEIQHLVNRAGVNHATVALRPLNPDSEVPF